MVRYMSAYFKNDKQNFLPVVRAILRSPLNDKSLEMEFIIDTGFQGGILVPLSTYIDLGLNRLEEPKVSARTAVGTVVELRTSRAIVRIGDLEFMCSAYTTLGVKKPLIGREVLKKAGLLYRPPTEIRIGI
jgi:clan AA aspartic protease